MKRKMPMGGYLRDFDGRAKLRQLSKQVADKSGRDYHDDILPMLIEADLRERSPDGQIISRAEIELEFQLHSGDMLREMTSAASEILGFEISPPTYVTAQISPEWQERIEYVAVASD